MLHDGRRIVFTDDAAKLLLERAWHPVGLCNVLGRHCFQLRHETLDELSLGILILDLLDRRVDPDSVDSGDPRLHLRLTEVNAWLEVEELAAEMQSRRPPREP